MEQGRSWHFDSQTKEEMDETATRRAILPATEKDFRKVAAFYYHCPVPGYEIASVEVLYNRALNRTFSLRMDLLEKRSNNPTFMPKWHDMDNLDLRQKTMDLFDQLTHPYTDPDYPAVRLFPGWHGTSLAALSGILDTGYENLATTDKGFFGKGLYSSYEAEYAHRVYSKGALIFNWVAVFSPLPVVVDDKWILEGKANYGNYDAHFVPVCPSNAHNPNEVIYYPCKPGQPHTYVELVVFQAAACLPRYSVMLQKALLKSPAPVPGMEWFNQGHQAELSGDLESAQHFFSKSSEEGYPPAYIRLMDLSHIWGISLSLKEQYLDQIQQHMAWLNQASKADPIDASYDLGRCYEMGWGMSKNKAEAFACYQQSLLAKSPSYLSYHRMAWCYERGLGVKINEVEAVKYYRMAAEQGYAPAMAQLGYCYQQGIGVLPDIPAAMTLYQEALHKNYIGASLNLAFLYEHGIGVQTDFHQAAHYYKFAADKGHVNAQFILGCFYEEGKQDFPRDVQQARYYYRQADQEGHAMAKAQLETLEDQLSRLSIYAEISKTRPIEPLAKKPPEKNQRSSVCVLQ